MISSTRVTAVTLASNVAQYTWSARVCAVRAPTWRMRSRFATVRLALTSQGDDGYRGLDIEYVLFLARATTRSPKVKHSNLIGYLSCETAKSKESRAR